MRQSGDTAAPGARPIFPPDQPYNGQLKNVLPDDAALESLQLVSAQLHAIAPDGTVPEAEELDRLRSRLGDLMSGVRGATDIPDSVKHLIVARLADVEKAIDHLDVGGPEAIRRATEAVMGSVLFAQDAQSARSQTVRKVWVTLLAIWTVFSAGPMIQASIDAWQQIVPELQGQTSTRANDHGSDESAPAAEQPSAKR